MSAGGAQDTACSQKNTQADSTATTAGAVVVVEGARGDGGGGGRRRWYQHLQMVESGARGGVSWGWQMVRW
jgi:hypothetical protein